MLCHLLESFDIFHVLTEAFLDFQYKCPDSPISTIYNADYYEDFHQGPLPNSAASIHFLHCRLLAEFACT